MNTILPSIKPLALAVSLLVTALPSMAAESSDQPKPGLQEKKLETLVGEWTYEGTQQASPFGPAGKFSGKQTSQMVLSGFFREDKWRDKSDSGFISEGINLIGFDSAKSTFIDTGFENDGAVTSSTTTVSGTTWTTMGTRTDAAGKVYQVRNITNPQDGGQSVHTRAEYSADRGQTWKPWFDLVMKRVVKH